MGAISTATTIWNLKYIFFQTILIWPNISASPIKGQAVVSGSLGRRWAAHLLHSLLFLLPLMQFTAFETSIPYISENNMQMVKHFLLMITHGSQ